MAKAKHELYAFWGYDQFPFCLGGEISEVLANRRVVVPSYGHAQFTPFALYPVEAGKAIRLRLDGLATEYDSQLRELNRKFRRSVNEIIKLPGKEE